MSKKWAFMDDLKLYCWYDDILIDLRAIFLLLL